MNGMSVLAMDQEKPNVLVVDDQKNWLDFLSVLLKDEFNVQTARSYLEALEKSLAQEPPFHVIVTDLRLVEDEISEEGMRLLNLFNQRKGQCQVILVTAYPSIQTIKQAYQASVFEYLEKAHFDLKHYIEVVRNAAETAEKKRQEATDPEPRTRSACILLITVTKVETQAVLNTFKASTSQTWQRRHIEEKTYYSLGEVGGAEIFLVQSEMGTGTPGGALLTTYKAIAALHPNAVIMVGIAFGTKPVSEIEPKGQNLGDILVAKQIMAYEPGRIKGEFRPRGDRVTVSTNLLDKFRSGEIDWEGAPVQFGLILSGEKLVNDLEFRTQLLNIEPEAIGGEMEGSGLFVAASDAQVDWILVKAICDWADGFKDDKGQSLAAKNAAQFVCHVLELGGVVKKIEQQDK
jgi:nucleoside phosphorylase